jgi:hypothetical protein
LITTHIFQRFNGSSLFQLCRCGSYSRFLSLGYCHMWEFNILSFSVAGLPAILNDNNVLGDKATNSGTIGTLFAEYDYDVIHVQEDFAYHAVSSVQRRDFAKTT